MLLLEHMWQSTLKKNNSLGLQALEGWEMLNLLSAESRDDICPAISHMRWWKGCVQPHTPTQTLKRLPKIPIQNTRSELCFPFFPLLPVTWEVSYANVALTAISDLFNSSMKGTWKEAVATEVVTMDISTYYALRPSCWGAKKCLPIIAAFNQSSSWHKERP